MLKEKYLQHVKLDKSMYLHAPEFRVPHPLTKAYFVPEFSGAQLAGGRQAGWTLVLNVKAGETIKRMMSLSKVLEL